MGICGLQSWGLVFWPLQVSEGNKASSFLSLALFSPRETRLMALKDEETKAPFLCRNWIASYIHPISSFSHVPTDETGNLSHEPTCIHVCILTTSSSSVLVASADYLQFRMMHSAAVISAVVPMIRDLPQRRTRTNPIPETKRSRVTIRH
jgi:hypothetical protein